MKEERMRQEKEISQLKKTTRLQNEEQERQWNKEHKEQGMKQEGEISQLKETTRLEKMNERNSGIESKKNMNLRLTN